MTFHELVRILYDRGCNLADVAVGRMMDEVEEETGIRMEIDRLGFVHENYFYGDCGDKTGKLIYEISFFFYMKVPEDFEPASNSFTEDEAAEYLRWISPDEDVKFYPEFFRTELLNPSDGVKYFVTDDR